MEDLKFHLIHMVGCNEMTVRTDQKDAQPINDAHPRDDAVRAVSGLTHYHIHFVVANGNKRTVKGWTKVCLAAGFPTASIRQSRSVTALNLYYLKGNGDFTQPPPEDDAVVFYDTQYVEAKDPQLWEDVDAKKIDTIKQCAWRTTVRGATMETQRFGCHLVFGFVAYEKNEEGKHVNFDVQGGSWVSNPLVMNDVIQHEDEMDESIGIKFAPGDFS